MPSKKRKYEARFPPARIKKIIQTDEEIGKVAAAVPVIISRSLEIFLQSLVETTAKYTNERKAKTMTTSHLKHCIENEGKFDFLKDLVANIADIANEEDDGGGGGAGGDNVEKPKKQRKPRQTNQEKKKKKKETSSEEESDAQSENEDVGQTQRSMPSSPNSSDDIHAEEAIAAVATAENQPVIAACDDPMSNVQAASSSATHTLSAPRNGHSSPAMPSPKHVQAMPSPKHVQTMPSPKHVQTMPSPKHVQTMPSPKHVQTTHNTSPYASPHHNFGNSHVFSSPQQSTAQHSPMDLKHTVGGCTPSPNSMGDKSEKEYLSLMYSKDNKIPPGEEQIATNSSCSSSSLSSKLSHPAASLSSKLSHPVELSHPAASLNMPSPVRSPYGMTSPSVPSSLNLPSTATLTSPSPKLPSPLNLSSRNVPSPIYMPDELSLSQKIMKNISQTCQGSSTMVSLEGSGSATSMHSSQHNLGESTSILPTHNLSRQPGNITKPIPGNITKPIPANITKPMPGNITKPVSRPSHSIESIMGITSKDSSVNQNREELRQSQSAQVAIATSFMPNFNLHGNHGSHGNEPPIATSFQPNFSTPFKLTKDDEEDDYDT